MGGGGKLDDAVEGSRDEIGKLHLDHRTQPHQRHAGRRADKAKLRNWRVDHTARPELRLQPFRDLERAAKVAGDVLAHDEHVRVAAHLLAQRLADGGDVGHFTPCIHRRSTVRESEVASRAHRRKLIVL
jgi:hypothetical protein